MVQLLHIASSPLTLELFVLPFAEVEKKLRFRPTYMFSFSHSSSLLGDAAKGFLPRDYRLLFAWFATPLNLRVILAAKPGIVNVHTPATALALVWCLKFLKLSGIKLIYTARGSFDESSTFLKRSLWRLFDPLKWQAWDGIAVVNHHLRDAALRFHPPEKITVMTTGAAQPPAADISPRFANRTVPANSAKIRLGWVGRYSGDKRPLDFARLVHILNHEFGILTEGIMAGGSSRLFELRLRPLRVRRILELGWVRRPQNFLVSCDLYISTSVREGYGLVPLEAALVGTPTIAYRTLGTQKSVLEVGGELVPVGDVRRLAQAVVEWLELNEQEKKRRRVAVYRKAKSLQREAAEARDAARLYGKL